MSIKMIDLVFKSNMPQLKTDKGEVVSDVAAKFVLLSLADHADDEGRGAFPSVKRLCMKTNLSVATVSKALNALRNNGLIRQNGRSRWNTFSYIILVAEISKLQWLESGNYSDCNSIIIATKKNPSLNRQLNRPAGGLSEKPNAEPAEQIKIWTEISQDPAMKPHLRVEAIQSLLGARLNVHAATRRWKELALFVDARQQEQGQMLETFLQWLTSKRDFDLRYWSPGRMMELWPQAFPKPVPTQRERQWTYVNGELVEVME